MSSSSSVLHFDSSLLVFNFLFRFLLSLDFLISHLEFSSDLFRTGHRSLHPGVADNIGSGETLAGNELEHTGQERNKLFREASLLVAGMRSPEYISAVSRDEFIKTITRSSLGEWRVAGNHNEQDDTHSEEVNSLSLVRFLGVDLRSHVRLSSELCEKLSSSCTSSERSGKAKVSDFNVKLSINEHVLRLEISVSDSLGVEVVDSRKHLSHVEAADLLVKCATVGDVVE